MDPTTAPLGEVLDWLAERDGWVAVRSGSNGAVRRCVWRRESAFQIHTTDTHPITLDRLAGMLPRGYLFEVSGIPGSAVYCAARNFCASDKGEEFNADTELEARARVVAAVLGRVS